MSAGRWTDREDDLIRLEYPTSTAAEVAVRLRELYGRDVSPSTVMARANRLGVTKPGHVDWRRHPEYDEFLSDYAPGHGYAEVSSEMGRRFGVEPSAAALNNHLHKIGVRTGHNGSRFPPGHEPWTKGRKWDEFMSHEAQERCRRGQFRPGQLPHNVRPVGDERVSSDGYAYVHVAQHRRERLNDQWVSKARLVWEREHGRELGPDEVVIHANGDKGDYSPGNLVAMSRAEHVVVQTGRMPYADAETAETARAIADLAIATRRAAARARGGRSDGGED